MSGSAEQNLQLDPVEDPDLRKDQDIRQRQSRPPLALTMSVDMKTGRADLSHDLDPEKLRAGRASAVVEAELPDGSFLHTYDMQGEVAHELVRIQERYDAGTAPQAVKAGKAARKSPFAQEIDNILRWQEFIDMISALREHAERTTGRAKDQDRLSESLSNHYAYDFGVLRNLVRNESDGVEKVRELLRSGKEPLVEIGIHLAREPDLRGALQEDLVVVCRDDTLTTETRERARAFLRFRSSERLAEQELAARDF